MGGVNGNGNGNGNGRGPWWVELLKTVGPTAAIAVGLTYWVTQSLTPVLQHMDLFIVQQQTADTESAQEHLKEWEMLATIQAQDHRDSEAIFQIEQQVCVNAAKSPYQAAKCTDARNAAETHANQ
jgi:hypothetical protein